jgi:hypothetical protein
LTEEKNRGVNAEVEKRLDALFGGEADDHAKEVPQIPPLHHDKEIDATELDALSEDPLREFKYTVLSLDWEISDELMTKFIAQIEDMKQVYKEDKYSFLLLRLLEGIGRYILAKKGKADPEAIKLLNSGHGILERLATSKDLMEIERKRMLMSEVKKFKNLKERISKGKTVPKKPVSEGVLRKKQPTEKTDKGTSLPADPYEAAVNDLKQFIRAELDALKSELRLWMQEQKKTN